MNVHQARRSAGAPTGGQLAGKTQPAAGYNLEPDPVTIDGRPVEPEVTVMRSGGRRSELYYREGQLHDPDDVRPAALWSRSDGSVESEAPYRDGRRHDPDDARPAVVLYRADGTVVSDYHFRDRRPVG